MTRAIPTVLVLSALGAAPSAAQEVGEGFRCPGPEGRGDVLATVGRTDRLSEVAGTDVDTDGPEEGVDDPIVLHLQLAAEAPDAPAFVAHAPFGEAAVAGCVPEAATPFDAAAFEAGLERYRAAVQEDGAAIFEIPPGEAFWQIRGATAPANGG